MIIRRHPGRDESDSGLKAVYGRREIFWIKGYEELCVIIVQEMRDRTSTAEGAERSGKKIEKSRAENGALANSAGRRR